MMTVEDEKGPGLRRLCCVFMLICDSRPCGAAAYFRFAVIKL